MTQIVKAETSVIRAFSTDITGITEAMAVNIGRGGLAAFDLPRIKCPTGGATQWLVPVLEGDTSVSSVEGVIVFQRDTRSYWKSGGDDDAISNTPPDCSSSDCETGRGDPGGACSACPLAVFGTASKGQGQACKQTKQLFFLRSDNLLPEMLILPPTSIKGARQFLSKLTTNGVPYFLAVVRLELVADKNEQKKPYSRAVLNFVRRLSEDEGKQARQYHEMIKQLAVNSTAAPETEQAFQE
jgi:hypothetical protein